METARIEEIAFDVPTSTQEFVNKTLLMRKNASRATAPAKMYKANFIEPGLCNYEDVDNSGNVLLTKPTIDKMLTSIVGVPVVDSRHQTPEDGKFRDEAEGIVTRAWFDPADAQYWCEYIVWDPHLQALCDLGAENGQFSVSCAYDPTDGTESGGEWHSIPYEGEITNGAFTHLAIVPNPRYEGARIHRCNSKGGLMFGWNKDKKREIKDTDTVQVGDKKVTIKELVELHNAKEAGELTDETEIEIGDKRVTLASLKAPLVERLNATDEDDEEKKKKAKEDEERKNAEDKAQKDKDDEERKNAEDKEAKDKKDEEERKNSRAHFETLQKSRMNTEGVDLKLETKDEQVARGREMFGSKKKV